MSYGASYKADTAAKSGAVPLPRRIKNKPIQALLKPGIKQVFCACEYIGNAIRI